MFDKLSRLKDQSNIVFKSKFLANLNPAERYEFLQLCHRRSYKEGEYVFYKNDPGTGMYFIEKGKIQLTIGNPDEETAEDIISELELESPDSFGALSIGYNLRRKSSARCVTDCDLLGFFKPDFEVLRDRHPQIAVKFLQTLTNIALRQLETTARKLAEVSSEQLALNIQFQTYYEANREEKV
ncbi:MAG: cyclic nucleotide-binding domain-containing protein [Gracilimonas sp.]|uniref:cyclic nucleotide-binding domain-containing protein n=1 Tax=Gracilimonas TaxID=649462 RepID=UPI001B163EB5|nr:cyclic nucleotide-binding domain-containing protein [Gracilimonas sp.]MBO6586240.1 cyclic nucleotide-binding domain-containing protein [Gracilimonas sp.]MBO6614897.1 cyclic nucleotide-binding domain-containing protein [Gracilimonas sp.]